MSQACISYRSLDDAASTAKKVADKLETYASHLDSQIYRKINEYSGTYTSNVSQSKNSVNMKITDLNRQASLYREYAKNLSDLREQCKNTDFAVKTRISKLTAEFKGANGIKNSIVENSINFFLTSISNSSSTGRWLGNNKDGFDSAKEYVKQSLKTWWDYEGGKELVTGLTVAAITAVTEALIIIGAVGSGGGIAILISSVIAYVNACVDFANEIEAYWVTNNGDPATGRRRSKINSTQEYLRSSFVFDDSGEFYIYDEGKQFAATTIDLTKFVCDVINGLGDLGDLTKKSYKWTTGSTADLKDIKITEILNWENISAFTSKLWGNAKGFIADPKTAIKSANLIGNFAENIKNSYSLKNINSANSLDDMVKNSKKFAKNYGTVVKTILDDGLNLKSIFKKGIDISLKNISVTKFSTEKDGEIEYDSINASDISGLVTNAFDFLEDSKDIYEKLTGKSKSSINIPDIKVPQLTGINSLHIQTVY